MERQAPTTIGEQLIASVDLYRLRKELEGIRNIPFDLRTKRRNLQAELDLYNRSTLATAREELDVQKAWITLKITDQMDEKTGKPRFTNENTRAAAMVVMMSKDPDYQGALSKLRECEKRVASLQLQIQECDDGIKSNAELVWTLRTLVDGARAEVAAICTFDGPVMPAEIPLVPPKEPMTVTVRHLGDRVA